MSHTAKKAEVLNLEEAATFLRVRRRPSLGWCLDKGFLAAGSAGNGSS